MHVFPLVKTLMSLGLLTALDRTYLLRRLTQSLTLWRYQPFSLVRPAGGATPLHLIGCCCWQTDLEVQPCPSVPSELWGGGARQKDGSRTDRTAIPSTALHRTPPHGWGAPTGSSAHRVWRAGVEAPSLLQLWLSTTNTAASQRLRHIP